jgi:hypothetical protein
MQGQVDLTVTLDRAAGTAELRKRLWAVTIPAADLAGWAALYRQLWSRPAKDKGAGWDIRKAGPWAGHYENDMRALERAAREAEAWKTADSIASGR